MKTEHTQLALIYSVRQGADGRGIWKFWIENSLQSKDKIAANHCGNGFMCDELYIGDEILDHVSGMTRTVCAGERVFCNVMTEENEYAEYKDIFAQKLYSFDGNVINRVIFDIHDLHRIFNSLAYDELQDIQFYVIRNGQIFLVA